MVCIGVWMLYYEKMKVDIEIELGLKTLQY